MVVKLAGKCMLFGLIIWSIVEPYSASISSEYPSEIFRKNLATFSISFISLLTAVLAFLEVRWAIYCLIIKLIFEITQTNDSTLVITNLVFISGILIYLESLIELKPLISRKRY